MVMRGFIFFFLLFSIVFKASSRADTEECQRLKESIRVPFEISFKKDYRPLMCSDNVIRLRGRLQEQGVDFSKAYVVLVRHKHAPHLPIHPMQPRLSTHQQPTLSPRWLFHVFVVFDGLVLDLDYGNNPQLSDLYYYLQNMWPSEQHRNDYVTQIKRLTDYGDQDIYGRLHGVPVLKMAEAMAMLLRLKCSGTETQTFMSSYLQN